MADTERDLADCVGAIYGAASNGGSWLGVGQRLCRLLDAQRATLRIGPSPLQARNVLMPPDESEALYAQRFPACGAGPGGQPRRLHVRRRQLGGQALRPRC